MIPLVAPTITRRDRDTLTQAVYNGALDNETEVRRFEEDFAAYVGAENAVAVASGTTALRLALDVLCIESVTLPTYSCEALLHATEGKRRQFVDASFEVTDAQMVQEEWSTIYVAMFGTPTNTVYEGEPPDVEDWTLSLGFPHELASDETLGVCSTHASKMLSTGRGGIVYGEHRLLETVRGLANMRSIGMSSPQAILGRSQLRQLPDFIERRRLIAIEYSAAFEQAGIECPDPECGSVFFRYMIRLNFDPAAAVLELAKRGIEAGRGVYPPLHRTAGLPDEHFPGAMHSVNTLLSVPCHPALTDNQVRYIAEQIVQVCAP